ncbi:MAG: hypothetical protein OEY85_13400, partial [Rhodospirillales bacterium]|nr:hypothetical protein [Rhodospirillales bacterium]
MVAVAVTAGNPRAESGSHELAIRNIQETRQADFSLRACAEAGKAMCQAALALKFEACYGVSCDPGEAFQWMLKAAEQGFVPAQRSVGLSYFLGRGIGKDEQKAAQWINRAALQGDDEATL